MMSLGEALYRETARPVEERSGTPPIVIATILREEGPTGVHTHVREVSRYFRERGISTDLVTPFSWGGPLTVPVFGARLALQPVSGAAGVAWYRYWHEAFLAKALRHHLAQAGGIVLYAQGPEAARACLKARQGPHQRVVMAVHYQYSQAENWVDKGYIKSGGSASRAIRRMEKAVIPQLDGIVYVSRSTREHLLSWLPEADNVRSTVIPNFVKPIGPPASQEPLGDLVSVGSLEQVKGHAFLLEVLAAAKRAGKTFTLDVYGEGPLHEKLLRTAQTLGVEGQFRLRGHDPDVRSVLPRYRAYLHAASNEAGPLAITEAMAAGLPIIAVKDGGSSELYEDGVEGRFWSLEDAAGAASTMIELLASEQMRAKVGAAAKARFQRNLDANVLGPRLESFLLADASPQGRQLARA
jgi:glycosyltransferase involved in cell wall biosynthesis